MKVMPTRGTGNRLDVNVQDRKSGLMTEFWSGHEHRGQGVSPAFPQKKSTRGHRRQVLGSRELTSGRVLWPAEGMTPKDVYGLCL